MGINRDSKFLELLAIILVVPILIFLCIVESLWEKTLKVIRGNKKG